MDDFLNKSANMDYFIIQKYIRIELNEFIKFIDYHENNEREKIKERMTFIDHIPVVVFYFINIVGLPH